MLGVAEAKRRFSELIERVGRGERFVICRRGRPAVALVSPKEVGRGRRRRPMGLAAFAGALGDWEELEVAVKEIYLAREKARDRKVPELE
jgi:prevent-host-death family protein